MTPSLADPSTLPSENVSSSAETEANRLFNLFPYLNDDLKLTILSYVADAPLEALPDNYIKSSLTHELPQVSKKFHSLTKCDTYWKLAIARQTDREPLLWRKALARMCNKANRKETRSVSFERRQRADDTSETNEELIERTHKTLGKPSYKDIYQRVVSKHLRFKGPALIMLGRIQMGVPYELDLTEPRYQDVLRESLREHPAEARQGGPIDRDAIFVHVNRGPLEQRTPAVLVQVLRCQIGEESTHVVLLPFAHVWLEKAWMRPEDEMVFVQSLKMGKGVTADMNRLARQEALAGVLDQLAVDVLTNDDMADESDSDDDDEEEESDDDEDDDSSSSSGFSELEELEQLILGD